MLQRTWREVIWIVLFIAAATTAKKRSLEGRQHWWDLAQNEILAALNVRENWNVAKNVILFLGDGMGVTVNTAGRIYKGQKKNMNGEEGFLTWERFPDAALLKTYNVDKQVPDSAATATAYLCGIKANYYTIGVDSSVKLGDCAAQKNTASHTPSILAWAQDAGKDTGFVTTTRVTHATPAALYAHTAHRAWECDSKLGLMGAGCKDIADQLVSEEPGKNIKLIFGGGRQNMGAPIGDPTPLTCVRKDGRNLVQEWLKHKTDQGKTAKYVTTTGEMNDVDVKNTDYLLGLFDNTHTPYEIDRKSGPSGTPSITEMTLKAIEFLEKGDEGYFLLVEGGRIDHALHETMAYRALEDLLAMDEAVEATLKHVDLEDTLVIVTADHSHVMTINGYPERGNNIIGLSGEFSEVDGLPYTTLMFTNGPGYNYSVVDGKAVRVDPSKQDIFDADFRYLSAVPTAPDNETHGGEDVAVWAAGPMSHLFHRTHEQNYVAHVMAYASCVGPNTGSKCQRPAHAKFTKGPIPNRPFEASGNPSILDQILANAQREQPSWDPHPGTRSSRRCPRFFSSCWKTTRTRSSRPSERKRLSPSRRTPK
ncbi:alkaline phosphatase-like [Macrobrachium nipponense]|uniref:alkaline phosphatase-like n=1 Tax=Macrobrachium nipponense TaxID=159736 RepID=UPI0030C7C338